MTTFGNKLHLLMKDNDMTQQELADKLNVRRGTVSNWITSRRCPDADTLVRISDCFNVTVDYLLKDVTDKNIEKIKDNFKEIEELYEHYKNLDDANKFLIDSLIKSLIAKQKDK